MLTAFCDERAVRELVDLGIAGYVLKDDGTEAVAEAIACVAQGGRWFSPEAAAILAQEPSAGVDGCEAPDLTGRERELLALVGKGWDNRRIAAELSLGRQTVRNYLSAVYAKLGVTSRAEAVVWAREHDVMGVAPAP